jgi:hypothetical protein
MHTWKLMKNPIASTGMSLRLSFTHHVSKGIMKLKKMEAQDLK